MTEYELIFKINNAQTSIRKIQNKEVEMDYWETYEDVMERAYWNRINSARYKGFVNKADRLAEQLRALQTKNDPDEKLFWDARERSMISG